MDVLPSDNRGFVPLMECRTIGKDEWIGFNTHMAVIPVEAMDYRSQRPIERCTTGPTGVFLEMEWGLDMDCAIIGMGNGPKAATLSFTISQRPWREEQPNPSPVKHGGPTFIARIMVTNAPK